MWNLQVVPDPWIQVLYWDHSGPGNLDLKGWNHQCLLQIRKTITSWFGKYVVIISNLDRLKPRLIVSDWPQTVTHCFRLFSNCDSLFQPGLKLWVAVSDWSQTLSHSFRLVSNSESLFQPGLKLWVTVSAWSQTVSHCMRKGNFNWAQAVILKLNWLFIHNVWLWVQPKNKNTIQPAALDGIVHFKMRYTEEKYR